LEVNIENTIGAAFWHDLGFEDYQIGLKLEFPKS
jgi:hypothetical protein